MPSHRHEGLIELFRARRTLAVELLRTLCAVALPDATGAEIASATFAEVRPAEYAADLVLIVKVGRRRIVVVIEAELGTGKRARRAKQRAWPRYVSSLWSDHGLPVYLVVVTPSPSVERWASQPIQVGHPGFTLRPIVIGPSNVPRVIDRERAIACPELAVLCAVVHGRERGPGTRAAEIGKLAVEAAMAAGAEECKLYVDLVLDALGKPARREVELTMIQGYQYRSELFQKLLQQGREEGLKKGREEGLEKGREQGLEKGREQALARDVIEVLAARGFKVPKKTAARVHACREVETLREWLRRAATLTRIDELFA